MNNTGYQQATIARKVSRPGNHPLDVNGELCSESKKKQAILLLEGTNNPNPSLYEVKGTFKPGEVVDGYETRVFNPEACPVPEEITLPPYVKQPMKTVFADTNKDYNVETNNFSYSIHSADWDGTYISPLGGGWNRGTYHTRQIGEYEWFLENWKMDYVVGRAYSDYKITQQVINNSLIAVPANMTVEQSNRLNGCYSSSLVDMNKYMSGIGVFLPENKYFVEGDDTIRRNRFVFDKASNFNVVDNVIVKDKNCISFHFDNIGANTAFVMSRIAQTNNVFRIYPFWGSIQEGNNQIVKDNNNNILTVIGDDRDSVNYRIGSSNHSVLFVISTDGTKIEDLPLIKIEYELNASSQIQPTTLLPARENVTVPGWKIPAKDDFAQLLGMLGEKLDYREVMKHLFISPDDDLGWFDNWLAKDYCQDTIGSRLLPAGHKQNRLAPNVPGTIKHFGERASFMVDTDWNETISDAVWFDFSNAADEEYRIVFDDGSLPNNKSIQAWQRNIRLCRPLTDEELGYKLWVDEANDKILVTSLSQSQPSGTRALPKGLLRGVAVRWMNTGKTKVIVPLSRLREEIEKTKNNAGYGWYGWH